MDAPKRPFPVFLLDMAADLAAVLAAYFAAYYLRFQTPVAGLIQAAAAGLNLGAGPVSAPGLADFYCNPVHAFRIILLLSLTLVPLNAFFGLYSGRRFLNVDFVALRLFHSAALALLLFVSYLYLSHNQFHPRSTFLLLMTLQFIFSVLFRKAAAALMAGLRARRGLDLHPALLAGESEPLDAIESWLQENRPHGIFPARRTAVDPSGSPSEFANRLLAEARACGADTLCAADRRPSVGALMELLDRADAAGLTVKLASPRLAMLIHPGAIEADVFQTSPLIHFSPTSDFIAIQRLRRIGSVLFSAGFLLLTAPLFLALAVLIKLTSRGPVFFIQDRVGRNGQVFRMFKFRTMTAGSETMKPDMAGRNDAGHGALFKIRRDPRVTPFGRLLRKFSLDELPQFFNVLRGEMNVVGPRPLPVEDCRLYYEPWHRSRHKGLPGITGLWQVSGRSDLTFEQMCVLDIYYLHNASLSLDLKIIARTVNSILFAKGAY